VAAHYLEVLAQSLEQYSVRFFYGLSLMPYRRSLRLVPMFMKGLIVGGVVVLAVTFAQGMSGEQRDRRILPGILGLCTIPVLALIAGSLAAMTTGNGSGLAAGFTALIALLSLRIYETRRSN